jgi:hypothetical protein
MIWNLSSAESSYDISIFNNRVAQFDLNKALYLNLKFIFDICRSICAWILTSSDNVCIIQCSNGLSRTGNHLALAIYHRNSNIVLVSVLSAFEIYI